MNRGSLLICIIVCATKTNASPIKCPSRGVVKIPDSQNDQQYFVCNNGVPTSKRCAQFEIFDSKKSDCIHIMINSNVLNKMQPSDLLVPKINQDKGSNEVDVRGHIDDPSFVCPTQEMKDFPDPDDCKKYYHCDQGSFTIEECPKYFLFDAMSGECKLFMLCICYNYTTQSPPTTVSSICPPDKIVDLPYPKNCRKYYHCNYGAQEVRTCRWFYRFDKNKLECRFFLLAKCENKIEEFGNRMGTIFEEKETLNEGKRNTTSNEIDSELQVNVINSDLSIQYDVVDENYTCHKPGIYDDVYPGNCHEYYHCNNRTLTVDECPLLKNFDVIELTCIWIWQANCRAAQPTASTSTNPTPSTITPSTSIITTPSTTTTTTTTTTNATTTTATTTTTTSTSTANITVIIVTPETEPPFPKSTKPPIPTTVVNVTVFIVTPETEPPIPTTTTNPPTNTTTTTPPPTNTTTTILTNTTTLSSTTTNHTHILNDDIH